MRLLPINNYYRGSIIKLEKLFLGVFQMLSSKMDAVMGSVAIQTYALILKMFHRLTS